MAIHQYSKPPYQKIEICNVFVCGALLVHSHTFPALCERIPYRLAVAEGVLRDTRSGGNEQTWGYDPTPDIVIGGRTKPYSSITLTELSTVVFTERNLTRTITITATTTTL